jgi:signal peptidase II
MKLKPLIRNLCILIIILCNVGCDQISKSIVRKEISEDQTISYLSNHFNILKVENTGAFLSLGDNLPHFVKFNLLTLLPVLVLFVGLFSLMQKNNLSKLTLIGFSFVIGGGIGNLYDRFVHGSVTDFMYINIGVFQTGIFNMADVSIMLGFGLVFLSIIIDRRRFATD